MRIFLELGRANKSEIGWIEDEHCPFAAQRGQRHLLDLLFLEHFELEVGHALADLHLAHVIVRMIMELAAMLAIIAFHFFHAFMVPSRLMAEQILIIAGPTASGKSGRAVQEALARGGEVISVDSRQVYRGLDIGTEKMTKEEMRGIPHHLIDIRDATESYSAGDFLHDAERLIADIAARGKLPILAGGTHFYFDALIKGLPGSIAMNPALRAELEQLSTEELFARVQTADPRRAAELDPQNRRRLVRALEIIAARGSVPLRPVQVRPKQLLFRSDLNKRDLPKYQIEWIMIDPPREELRANIDARLATALDRGLIEEVARVRAEVGDTRLNELGLEYKIVGEFLSHSAKASQDTTRLKEEILPKLSAKLWQYARRQKAWLRKLETEYEASPEK